MSERSNHNPIVRTRTAEAVAATLDKWYRTETERLGVTRREIEDAVVLRGWCGNEISELPAAEGGLLAGSPNIWRD